MSNANKPKPTCINKTVGKTQSSFKGVGGLKPKGNLNSKPTPKKGK